MSYVPERGDLVWLTFEPQTGHKQSGRRPAFVLSPEAYNRKTGLFLACPVSSRSKGYPFGVALPPGRPVGGIVLADQLKSLDWRARRAEFAADTPKAVVDEVLARVRPLIGFEDRSG